MLVSGSLCEGCVIEKIGGGIDQHLACNLGPIAVARGQRNHGGEVTAGAVAAHHQSRRVDAELFRVGGDPFRRIDRVIDGGGKLVFRRQPIVDGNDNQLAFGRELAARHVMGFKVADHPTAAVEKHQARREPVCLSKRFWRVDPRRDRAMRCGDRKRPDRFQLRRLRVGDEAGLQIELTRLRRCQRFIGGTAGFLERLVDEGGIGIENNGHGGKPLAIAIPGHRAAMSGISGFRVWCYRTIPE
jgi:hypothetical protein